MGKIAITVLQIAGICVAANYGMKLGFRAGSKVGSWLTDNVGGHSVGTFRIRGSAFWPEIVEAE